MEEQLDILFAKRVWDAADYALFLELLESVPAADMQRYFQENYIGNLEMVAPDDSAHAGELLGILHEKMGITHVKKHAARKYVAWVAAASIVLLSGLGAWFYFSKKTAGKEVATIQQPAQRDIAAPQVNRASITLANGKKLLLDSSNKGELAVQQDVKIVKLADGKIAYKSAASAGSAQGTTAVEYNTLENPRGSRVIDITLGDGTRVWLNAASSLRYPVAFAGNQREVEITGEAYFEVKHDARMPFRVKAAGELIEDVGTEFNVNAYTDEPSVKTTLIKGSVKVNTILLAPGEQAQDVNSQVRVIKNADVAQAVAWKNGTFSFHDADLKTVMRQLSRWYDVQVDYEGAVPAGKFSGEIGSSLTLKQVLEGLAEARVKYRITDGNRITIQQ